MKDKKREFAVLHGNSPFTSKVMPYNFILAFAMPMLVLSVLAIVGLISLGDAGGVALAAGPSTVLVEKRKEFALKQGVLGKLFEDAGKDIDFKLIKKIGDEDVSTLTTVAIAEKLRQMNEELTVLGEECETLFQAEEAAKQNLKRGELIKKGAFKLPDGGVQVIGNEGIEHPLEFKGLGTLFVESDAYKKHMGSDTEGPIAKLKVNPQHIQQKTLFQTTAGWAPESIRIARVIDAVTRPIRVIDIIPFGRTGDAAIVYMEETTRTHAAAELAEAGTYAESTFVLTERTSNVRKIGTSIPVTDEQLADVAGVESYLNQRLTFGLRQRLDGQILTGDGVAPNLEGILNVTGIQTQAKAADPVPDAVYKAIVLVRVTGRSEPNVVVFHPNDWQTVRLLKTADGIYLWGSPSESGPERIWGLSVVQTDAETENTALVGDFQNWIMLFERTGIEVKVGFINTDFTTGRQHIRADMRVALPTFRPAAFCTVTGI